LTGYWWSERIGSGYTHGYEIELLYEQRTPFQHMVIFENAQWGKGLILDGIVQVTQGDEFIYHEMMVHVPILGRNHPTESVLIIGGADGGILREVQKHDSVRRIVQVELDRDVLVGCRKYLPEICGNWKDERLELVIGDGAEYVKNAASSNEKFDLIILDSTDPIGPAIVLFEPPFHRNLAHILGDTGVIVRQSGLPVTMPRVMPFIRNRFLDVLPDVKVYLAPMPTYGGEIAFVTASRNEAGDITAPGTGYFGRYYNPDIHRASFTLPTWWQKLIEEFEDDGQVPIETKTYF
jgi:spermidine synthase